MAVQVKHVVISANGQWWVVNTSPASGTPTIYTVVEGSQNDALGLPDAGGVAGPYNSQTAADQIANAEPENTSGTNPIGAIGAGIAIGAGGESAAAGVATGQSLGSGLDALGGIAAALSSFFTTVTDGKLWRSLGWILLGIALMMAGVLWWIGPSASRASPLSVLGGIGRRIAT